MTYGSDDPPTTWTLVTRASGADPEAARRALGELIKRHQDALYFKLRRSPECALFARQAGCEPSEIADDAMQQLFASLVDGRKLRTADRSKGSFKNWLTMCGFNQLRKDWRQHHGGIRKQQRKLDDLQGAEQRYLKQPEELSADELCQLTFSLGLYRQAFEELRAEEKNVKRFELLKRYLFEAAPRRVEEYAPVADELDVMPRTVASMVSRLRGRLRAIVRARVTETLDAEQAHDESELRAHLRDHARILRDTPYHLFADYVSASTGDSGET